MLSRIPILRVVTAAIVVVTLLLTTATLTTAAAASPTPAQPAAQQSPAMPGDQGGCAVLRSQLASMAASGVRAAACTERSARRVATAPAAAGATPQSIVPPPSWCATNGAYYVYRTESCGVFSGVVNVYDTRTKTVVGQIFFNYISYSFTSASNSTWAHQLQIQETSQWGQFVSGTTVDGSASCTGACRLNSSKFPAQPVAQNRFDNGESYFNSTATAPGAVGSSTTTFSYTFHNSAWNGGSASPGSVTQISVRCDNALPGVSSAGCVFPLFVPVLNYALSGLYPQLARHIQDAQGSGLPGAYPSGSPLTRLTDQALQDQNRGTACPRSYPRPSGYSCDEYPFASSHQGAYLSGGGPRTFSYCQISLQNQSTGSKGYSVCMIDANQNSGGGNALGQFYNTNRVIESDPFYVWITA